MNSAKRLFSSTARHLKQKGIPASYYRGGTSRALIFNKKDLPANKDDWKPIFIGAMGSPDPNGRQLNGMGGGISSLSKICVVNASNHEDAQVDFTFVQVGIKNTGLDCAGNCGNMTSAIGPYAMYSGIVDASTSSSPNPKGEDLATVKLYNTNTQKHIHATFPISNGEPDLSGSFAIDGVSGTAAKIQLDFIDPAGSKTGTLLPTGNKIDLINGIRTSCIDAGNPCVFVSASDLNITDLSHLRPDDLQSQPELLEKLESIRRQATIRMGMAHSDTDVPPSIPKICIVDTPTGSYRDLSGQIHQDKEGVDVTVRAISTQQPHKALPITAGLALSAAARLEGTVVHGVVREPAREEITIGHPSGTLVVGAKYEEGSRRLERVTVYRTARRLMEGVVYWD
ncbi:DUF453 domain protein [Aspergillus sclerotialis]|uniref:DUF453 domain protein n=1 Tax=Aspergillus sclerotialis TaxID=2070753 RepID=A0A3A2ZVZ1_9EURO|nr:DUF453 domain protein [Aspergillus sclerotialis]